MLVLDDRDTVRISKETSGTVKTSWIFFGSLLVHQFGGIFPDDQSDYDRWVCQCVCEGEGKGGEGERERERERRG